MPNNSGHQGLFLRHPCFMLEATTLLVYLGWTSMEIYYSIVSWLSLGMLKWDFFDIRLLKRKNLF